MDGVVCLVGRLLGFGASSDAGSEVMAAGLGTAILSMAASGKTGEHIVLVACATPELNNRGQYSTAPTPLAGPLLELSPSGVLGMLSTLQLLSGADYLGPALVLIGDGSDGQSGPSAHPAVLPCLLRLLGEQHMAAVLTWPASADGGREGACRLVLTVVELLQGPFITDPGVWLQAAGSADQCIHACSQGRGTHVSTRRCCAQALTHPHGTWRQCTRRGSCACWSRVLTPLMPPSRSGLLASSQSWSWQALSLQWNASR